MVGTIIPIGYGGRHSFAPLLRNLTAHAAGAAIGGIASGVTFALLGQIVLKPAAAEIRTLLLIVAFTVVGLGYGIADILEFRLPRLQRRKQVPIVWQRRYSVTSFSFLYGASLGSGVMTYIRVSTVYLLIIWVFFTRSVIAGAVIFGVFGLSRALPLFRIAFASPSVRERLEELIDRLELGQGVVRFVNGLVMVVLTGAVGVALLRSGG